MAKDSILYFIPAILGALMPGGSGEISYDRLRSGNATYYLEADGTGNCMFDALPEPQYVGALNNFDYNTPVINGKNYANATLCGAYVRVKGNKGSILVKIVDRCPDATCTPGHIDLSPEAFSEIDDLAKGYVPITWQLVSVPVSGPLSFRYKDGSSQWWTAIQVRNHRNPVAKVEAFVDNAWHELPRQQYNYFVASGGLGKGYHTFRLTDIFGNQLTETSSVYLNDYNPYVADWQGKKQFPSP